MTLHPRIRVCLLAFSLVFTGPAACASDKETPTPPNIIVILADDIGVETVSAYGSEYRTPNIDSIAESGVRLDAAHATPICTPSRVRLLTGQYNYRNYVDFAVLPPGERTIAHQLRDAGFRTLVSGKWQLAGTGDEGDPEGTSPGDAGFDEHLVWYMYRQDKGSRFWGPKLFDQGEMKQFGEEAFGPTLINDRVVDFIKRDDDRPFFVFYSMFLGHKPWVTTPVSLDAEGVKERFSGMMSYMDKMIGNVLQALEDSGQLDNTLVIFLGDNGTHPDVATLYNGQVIRGGKWYTHDAATHIPMVLQWPGRLKGGQVSDSLVDVLDVMPTVLEASGLEVPDEADGFSLLPELTGGQVIDRDWIFFKFDPHADWEESLSTRSRFIFNHRWKLFGDGRYYDMENDFLEQHPLDVDGLSGEAAEAYHELSAALKTMDDGPFFHPEPGPGLPEHEPIK